MSVIVIGAGLPDASPPTIDSLRMGVDFGTSTLPMNPVGSLNSKTLRDRIDTKNGAAGVASAGGGPRLREQA